MKYSQKDINALIMKAAYEERLTLSLAKLLEAPNPDIMKIKSSLAFQHYEKMQALYKQIDNKGYEELPAGIYTKWLNYIADQKKKSKNDKKVMIIGLK